jgi:dephospho-CoA kinase
MPAIGITGGIATGKSTFCDCLRRCFPNARFFDADHAAHELINLAETKKELATAFGSGIFLGTGDLNREALRAIIFADAVKRRALEQILHPRIRRQWSALAETHRDSPEFFFADIPLLYETDGEKLCDRVVVVACSREIQLARLMTKKAIGGEEAEQMILSQMSLEEKIRRADHVVWNNDERSVLEEQTRLLAALWSSQRWTNK